jgi:hypothetical protein
LFTQRFKKAVKTTEVGEEITKKDQELERRDVRCGDCRLIRS